MGIAGYLVRHPWVVRYGAALAGVALATVVRRLLDPFLADHSPFMVFTAAIAFAAWYGGFGPAVLALLAGTFSAIFLILAPHGTLGASGMEQQIGCGIFLVCGLIIALLGGAMHRARQRAESSARQARRQEQRLGEELVLRQQIEAIQRESEQRFVRFMQHLPGLAWIKDLQGRYVFANDAALKVFGTPRQQFYGKTDAEIFPAETARSFVENDRQALASEFGVQVIETLTHDDGTLHHSLVSKFPIPGAFGRPTLVGGMAIDITDRLRVEEALREANRHKDEFLAMLAHELRNPLSPIRNALYILKQGGPVIVQEQVLAMMERQVQHMARLLDDLLDVSRISRGKIELRRRRVSLTAVVRRAVEAVRLLTEERCHRLTASLPADPLEIDADPTRLEQIVTNLLNNSCKYTDPGGQIWVSVGQEESWMTLRVRDNGIGIAPDMLASIFDLFVQAERRLDRSRGGIGIGLTLVRKLVELHGGAVEARSAGLGQGSEFVVRLPVPSGDKEVEAAGRKPSGSGLPEGLRPAASTSLSPKSFRVLVVDDNQDAANSLARLLRQQGQEVRVAYDGPSALTLAGEFHPEVAVLDIGLPGMDGYDLARRLRQQQGSASLYLVALTGWGQEDDRRRSTEAGFDRHLVKPIEPDSLLRLFQEELSEH